MWITFYVYIGSDTKFDTLLVISRMILLGLLMQNEIQIGVVPIITLCIRCAVKARRENGLDPMSVEWAWIIVSRSTPFFNQHVTIGL